MIIIIITFIIIIIIIVVMRIISGSTSSCQGSQTASLGAMPNGPGFSLLSPVHSSDSEDTAENKGRYWNIAVKVWSKGRMFGRRCRTRGCFESLSTRHVSETLRQTCCVESLVGFSV